MHSINESLTYHQQNCKEKHRGKYWLQTIYSSVTLENDIWTHWGRGETYICVSKLRIIGSDNSLSPGRCLAIIWANTRILLIWPMGTYFWRQSYLCNGNTHTWKKTVIALRRGPGPYHPWRQISDTHSKLSLCLTDQAITWTNIAISSAESNDIHHMTIPQEIPQPPITKISMEITYLKFPSNLPGVNELNAPLHVSPLTHWGRVTHICVSKLTSIGSDNGLPPGRRQAIIWTNARILLI